MLANYVLPRWNRMEEGCDRCGTGSLCRGVPQEQHEFTSPLPPLGGSGGVERRSWGTIGSSWDASGGQGAGGWGCAAAPGPSGASGRALVCGCGGLYVLLARCTEIINNSRLRGVISRVHRRASAGSLVF